MKRITLLAFGLCFASALHAYNPSVHRQLASFAVSTLLELSNYPAQPLSHEQLANIAANADSGEDTSPSTWLQRLTNWHFYNPYKEDQQQYTLLGHININRSMTNLVQQREQQLCQTLQKPDLSFDDFASAYGSCMHFIEDVTVPAHVTPVFHGPILPGGATGHSWPGIIHDPFDGYPVNLDALKKEWNEFRKKTALFQRLGDIEQLPKLISTLFDVPLADLETTFKVDQAPVLYCVDLTARSTLARLFAPENRLASYWSKDIGHQYFQGYGGSFDQVDEKQRKPFINKQHFLATVVTVALGIHLWTWERGSVISRG